MLDIILTVVVLFLVIALCLHHHSMKQQHLASIEDERSVIKQAATHSILASNTVNPLSAIVEVSKGERLIQFLHERHGAYNTHQRTGVDTKELIEQLIKQRRLITKDIIALCPGLVPAHPLTSYLEEPDGEGGVGVELP